MRYLRVTMTDGSVWEVPVSVIAKSREKSYREMGRHDLSDPENSDLLAAEFEREADDYDIADWAGNNMNWSDVKDVAVQVSPPPPPNFEEGWMNGKKKVVQREE